MKTAILLSLSLVGTFALAEAKIESCRKAVIKACGNNQFSHRFLDKVDRMTEGDQCKFVPSYDRADDGIPGSMGRVPERVVFKDADTMYAIVTSQAGYGEAQKCSSQLVQLPGKFVEMKSNSGRMFIVTSLGNVAVLTRTNQVMWLKHVNGAHNGKKYFNVVDISIDSKRDQVTLEYKNGSKDVATLSEVLKSLNNSYYAECVPGGCDGK